MATRPVPTEDEVQSVIVDYLRLKGFTVLVTTHRVKAFRCPTCNTGVRSRGDSGQTKGVPDLLVRRPGWPVGVMAALEVKRPGSWKFSSPEQKELWENGGTIVVTSLEEAAFAILRFEYGILCVRGPWLDAEARCDDPSRLSPGWGR